MIAQKMLSNPEEVLSASRVVEPVYPDRLNFGTKKPQLNKRKSSPASAKENSPTKIRRIDSETEEMSDDLGASKQTEELVDSMGRSDQLDGAHNTEHHITVNQGTGNITLWQFLLEILLSNKHPDLIRWTETEGEFILLQPQSVAKLWGLRKDPNHRMNYEKLGRALRYYYEKNIIRKVHGQKYVYQFIDLPRLIKLNNELSSENEWRCGSLKEERIIHKPDWNDDRTHLVGTQSSMNSPNNLESLVPRMNPLSDLMKSNIQQHQTDDFQLGNVGELLKEQSSIPLEQTSPLISEDINTKFSNLLSYISSIISASNLLNSVPVDACQNGYSTKGCFPCERNQFQTPSLNTDSCLISENSCSFPGSSYILNNYLSSTRCFEPLSTTNCILPPSNIPLSVVPNAVQPMSDPMHHRHERSSSPGCHCSCHANLSTLNSMDKRGDSYIEPPLRSVQLHNRRHEINMQRLGAQLSRVHNFNGLAASSTNITKIPSIGTEHTDEIFKHWSKTHPGNNDQYVWMPVPVAMLTTWSTLLGCAYQVPATFEHSLDQSTPNPSSINGSFFPTPQSKNQM